MCLCEQLGAQHVNAHCLMKEHCICRDFCCEVRPGSVDCSAQGHLVIQGLSLCIKLHCRQSVPLGRGGAQSMAALQVGLLYARCQLLTTA